MSEINSHLMTPQHPRWDEFCERLGGPEGCNFQGDGGANTSWTCAGGTDKTFATHILTAMGLSADDVAWSLEYFSAHGGHCDCEILFNVDERREAIE